MIKKQLLTINKIKKTFQVSGILLFVVLPVVAAAQMSSTNYEIITDSINFGGGNSSSTNYGLEDTLGEVATGSSESTNYELRAGYQQLDDYPISLSTTGNVTLPALGGISSSTSSATMSATVTTLNPSGYELSIRATTTPALQSGTDSFSDYTPSGADPDYGFSLSSGEAAFGYSPEGSDIATRFKDNGSICNTGSMDTANSCWEGFSASDEVIATKASATAGGGNDTDLVLRAGLGVNTMKDAGNYTATIEITAVTL